MGGQGPLGPRLEEREKEKTKAAGKEDDPIDPKAQINFPDEGSHIMPDGANRGPFVPASHCPAMVDERAQIIVAAETTQPPTTGGRWARWATPRSATWGYSRRSWTRMPDPSASRRSGTWRSGALTYTALPTTGGRPSGASTLFGRSPNGEIFVERMRRKVRSTEGKEHHRHRKFAVEPVFGQIKPARGLRQFLLRGFGKVQAPWKLWPLTYNRRK